MAGAAAQQARCVAGGRARRGRRQAASTAAGARVEQPLFERVVSAGGLETGFADKEVEAGHRGGVRAGEGARQRPLLQVPHADGAAGAADGEEGGGAGAGGGEGEGGDGAARGGGGRTTPAPRCVRELGQQGVSPGVNQRD